MKHATKVPAAAKLAARRTIKDTTFIGFQYNGDHAVAVAAVAAALGDNAKALGALASALAGAGNRIDAMVKIGV